MRQFGAFPRLNILSNLWDLVFDLDKIKTLDDIRFGSTKQGWPFLTVLFHRPDD